MVVDAFDVQGQIVSHLQQTNLEVTYSGSWTEADGGFTWSGGGISNLPEPPQGARMAETGVLLAALRDMFDASPSRRVFVWLDFCHRFRIRRRRLPSTQATCSSLSPTASAKR